METIRQKIINGASIHRVAERLILEIKKNTKFYKAIAAAKLAWIYEIPFDNALAIINEMDLTNQYL